MNIEALENVLTTVRLSGVVYAQWHALGGLEVGELMEIPAPQDLRDININNVVDITGTIIGVYLYADPGKRMPIIYCSLTSPTSVAMGDTVNLDITIDILPQSL